jgi:hypothetical protein
LPKPPTNIQEELADFVAGFYGDPLSFVQACFPWRAPGPLEHYTGPDEWQTALLKDIGEEVKQRGFDGRNAVAPIRHAIASGHGIGKTVMSAFLVIWILSTRPHSRGSVTANTFTQLETKTWATIRAWMKMSITSHWFNVTGDRISHIDHPETWFCKALTSKAEGSEGFAGQHARDSSSFYIFDEASSIADVIWQVAEGGLVSGSPFLIAFGNPTRNTGKFYRACFGPERHLWKHRSIDSRTSAITNKAQIAEWVHFYGEESDFVKVRVRGIPPAASELQFIPQDLVRGAQTREGTPLADEPLIAGVDVSGGGSAWNVCRFRRGIDARSIPPIRIPGEHGRDREVVISQLARVLAETDPKKRVTMMFIDSAFGAPIVERLHVLGYKGRVVEVNFGGRSADIHQANQRAYMWHAMKDWLKKGCIDKQDEKLEIDLTGPGYHINRQGQLVIESKQEMQKRNVPSPDDGDALALSFAHPVAPPIKRPADAGYAGGAGWMG